MIAGPFNDYVCQEAVCSMRKKLNGNHDAVSFSTGLMEKRQERAVKTNLLTHNCDMLNTYAIVPSQVVTPSLVRPVWTARVLSLHSLNQSRICRDELGKHKIVIKFRYKKFIELVQLSVFFIRYRKSQWVAPFMMVWVRVSSIFGL